MIQDHLLFCFLPIEDNISCFSHRTIQNTLVERFSILFFIACTSENTHHMDNYPLIDLSKIAVGFYLVLF